MVPHKSIEELVSNFHCSIGPTHWPPIVQLLAFLLVIAHGSCDFTFFYCTTTLPHTMCHVFDMVLNLWFYKFLLK